MSTVNNAARNEFIRSVKCIQSNDRHSLHTELITLYFKKLLGIT